MGNALRNSRAVMFTVVAVHMSMLQQASSGCECAPPPPPCVAYTETDLIFLGTVTKVDRGAASMRIDRVYKGTVQKNVALWDSGMCDGPALEVGQQYLMYTYDDGSGYLPARGCTRSRHVRYAKEDLAFLNGLSRTPATSRVFGQVTVDTGRLSGDDSPLSGATVELHGAGLTRTRITGWDGRYLFSGLTPGVYSVTASKAGYRQREDENDDPLEVIARGCEMQDVSLRKNWPGTISGRITRADGTPGPSGVHVDLMRVHVDAPSKLPEVMIGFGAETNEQGEYSIHNVAPGRYKVVTNIYMPPTAEYPYKTLYWPMAVGEKDALAVEVHLDTAAHCDFRLPPALKSTWVTVTVLLPDGTPARDVHANILGLPPPAGQVVTNYLGQFSFGAIEGFEYRVQDIFTAEARMASALTVSSADSEKPIIIKLIGR